MPKDIQPLNDDLYTDLSIEELEERLEMQKLLVTNVDADDYGCSCDDKCTCNLITGCHY